MDIWIKVHYVAHIQVYLVYAHMCVSGCYINCICSSNVL